MFNIYLYVILVSSFLKAFSAGTDSSDSCVILKLNNVDKLENNIATSLCKCFMDSGTEVNETICDGIRDKDFYSEFRFLCEHIVQPIQTAFRDKQVINCSNSELCVTKPAHSESIDDTIGAEPIIDGKRNDSNVTDTVTTARNDSATYSKLVDNTNNTGNTSDKVDNKPVDDKLKEINGSATVTNSSIKSNISTTEEPTDEIPEEDNITDSLTNLNSKDNSSASDVLKDRKNTRSVVDNIGNINGTSNTTGSDDDKPVDNSSKETNSTHDNDDKLKKGEDTINNIDKSKNSTSDDDSSRSDDLKPVDNKSKEANNTEIVSKVNNTVVANSNNDTSTNDDDDKLQNSVDTIDNLDKGKKFTSDDDNKSSDQPKVNDAVIINNATSSNNSKIAHYTDPANVDTTTIAAVPARSNNETNGHDNKKDTDKTYSAASTKDSTSEEHQYSLASVVWAVLISFCAGIFLAIAVKVVYSRYHSRSFSPVRREEARA